MKRIISLTAAIVLMISILNISAFAYTGVTDYVYTNEQEAFLDTVNLINSYSSGEVSFTDFISDLTYVQGKTVTAGLDVAAVKIKQFIDVCNLKFGADSSFGGSEHGGGSSGGSRTPITDIWNDICNKNNVPTETTQTSTMDMQGYGAVIIFPDGYIDYCQYVIRNVDDINGQIIEIAPRKRVSPSGYVSTSNSDVSFGSNTSTWKYYGDIRWLDGTQAPTDDEFVSGSIYNYEGLTDKELKELIEELADKIQQEYPDLSTVEGLLNAIYARLGNLDSDDDGAMLSAINAAIISLSADTKNNNAELIKVLNELKEAKTEGADLDPILKELKEVNESLDYLKTINTLDLIGDTIESLLELTESEKTFLDTYAGLILNLTAKLGYAPVAAMISNIEAIMFNGNPPQDISLEIYDTQVVLLSSSVFDDMQISSSLSLAKLFVSVLLVISWLYSMRKKITGGA